MMVLDERKRESDIQTRAAKCQSTSTLPTTTTHACISRVKSSWSQTKPAAGQVTLEMKL